MKPGALAKLVALYEGDVPSHLFNWAMKPEASAKLVTVGTTEEQILGILAASEIDYAGTAHIRCARYTHDVGVLLRRIEELEKRNGRAARRKRAKKAGK